MAWKPLCLFELEFEGLEEDKSWESRNRGFPRVDRCLHARTFSTLDLRFPSFLAGGISF